MLVDIHSTRGLSEVQVTFPNNLNIMRTVADTIKHEAISATLMARKCFQNPITAQSKASFENDENHCLCVNKYNNYRNDRHCWPAVILSLVELLKGSNQNGGILIVPHCTRKLQRLQSGCATLTQRFMYIDLDNSNQYLINCSGFHRVSSFNNNKFDVRTAFKQPNDSNKKIKSKENRVSRILNNRIADNLPSIRIEFSTE